MTTRWIIAIGSAFGFVFLTLPVAPSLTGQPFSFFEDDLVAAQTCDADAKPAPLDYQLTDVNGDEVNLADLRGKVILLNFWATWCAPCKKEMPSLDRLYQSSDFKNLEVFALNMEEPNKEKTEKFFENLKIQKLEIFFDYDLDFVKEFKLRGVPTTVLINKQGKEFARIIGEVNFEDRKFLKWLSKYD